MTTGKSRLEVDRSLGLHFHGTPDIRLADGIGAVMELPAAVLVRRRAVPAGSEA